MLIPSLWKEKPTRIKKEVIGRVRRPFQGSGKGQNWPKKILVGKVGEEKSR